jgi:hypothetical protein
MTAQEELSQWMIQHPIPTVNSRRIQKIIDYDPSMLDEMNEDLEIYTKFIFAADWLGLSKDEFIKKLTFHNIISIIRELKQKRNQWNIEYEVERKRLVEKYKSNWYLPGVRHWGEWVGMSGKKQKNKKRSLKKHRTKKRM